MTIIDFLTILVHLPLTLQRPPGPGNDYLDKTKTSSETLGSQKAVQERTKDK